MEHGLIFILLSLITYFLVKSRAPQITKTPVWLLWLVMMIPAFTWTGWSIIVGKETPLPIWLVVIPFFVCPLLYWWLVAIGRYQEPIKADIKELPTEVALPSESALRPISKTEETTLRNCFPWGVYYLQQIDYRPQAILCRGKLKTIPEDAYQTIKDNIEKAFGDRFVLLFQESFSGQPFFALVPNLWQKPAEDQDQVAIKPSLALGLMLITLFTTTLIGTELNGVTPEQLQSDSSLLLKGLPYSLSLMTIFGVHEFSHYFTAQSHKIRTTLPYFIPVPFFLGTFGAFIQTKSPIPHRKALFDVAIAGPVGGLIVTLPLLWWGLTQSQVLLPPEVTTALEDTSSFKLFDTFNPRFSCLMAIMAKLALGSSLGPEMYLDLHPAAIAGFLGLLITAFNLTPVGQLDGGHIVHAMFGQGKAALVGQISRILMLVLALLQPSLTQPIFLSWAIFLFFIPTVDQPALNDVSELNNIRDSLGLLALVLLIIILLPLPGAIATLFNF